MIAIDNFISWMNSPVVVAWNTLFGIVGFSLTIYVSIKTHKIDKVVRIMKRTNEFNKNRSKYLKTFEAFLESTKTTPAGFSALRPDLLLEITRFERQFSLILTLKDRFIIWRFRRSLNRPEFDATELINSLAFVIAILSDKKEE
ncbi:MAG: hypothetical protein E6579_11650 [Clostridium sp.]|nr:hypothetical protein [Clostridium sp.]